MAKSPAVGEYPSSNTVHGSTRVSPPLNLCTMTALSYEYDDGGFFQRLTAEVQQSRVCTTSIRLIPVPQSFHSVSNDRLCTIVPSITMVSELHKEAMSCVMENATHDDADQRNSSIPVLIPPSPVQTSFCECSVAVRVAEEVWCHVR